MKIFRKVVQRPRLKNVSFFLKLFKEITLKFAKENLSAIKYLKVDRNSREKKSSKKC